MSDALPRADESGDRLAELFEECAALANRLKCNARRLHRRDNLSASGRILLQLLQHHGPQTVPQLAALRSTSRQNIQTLVNRLLARGWIALRPNPGHRRSGLLALTPAGEQLLASVDAREAALLPQLPAGLSPAQLAACTAVLRQLRAALAPGKPRRRRETEPQTPGTAPASPAAPPPRATEAELPVSLL
jgi:DNA-binding MarR family transcriptional regulator